MAVLLSAFLLHGLVPGPDMLTKHLDVTFLMVWSLTVAHVIGAFICLVASGALARLAVVPAGKLVPIVPALMFLAAFQGSQSWGDRYSLILFGTLGWLMKLFNWPRPPLMELPGAKFEATKYTWLGSITKDTVTCISWKTSQVKTWGDMFKTEYKAGGEGKGSDPDVYATLIKKVFGAKIKLVTGYRGSANISLAMERGELDGLCGISYSTLRSRHHAWLDKKQIHILVQGALQPDPNLPNVPFMLALAKTEKQKQILRLSLAPQVMARPFVAPPGVPADRAKALQTAFNETMKDPAFLADAKRLKLDVDPMTGQELVNLLKQIYNTPKSVVKETRAALGY